MSLANFVKRIRDIMRNDAGINGDAQRIEQMAWMLFLERNAISKAQYDKSLGDLIEKMGIEDK